MVTMSIP
jgi:hypothetical protein